MAPEFICVSHDFKTIKFDSNEPVQEVLALQQLAGHVFKKGQEYAEDFQKSIDAGQRHQPTPAATQRCIVMMEP